jgi:hypothetical protein
MIDLTNNLKIISVLIERRIVRRRDQQLNQNNTDYSMIHKAVAFRINLKSPSKTSRNLEFLQDFLIDILQD